MPPYNPQTTITQNNPCLLLPKRDPTTDELDEQKILLIPKGAPMSWDLTMDDLDEQKIKVLARNIGQMVRENNQAGFLLLQSLPKGHLRKSFISELNEALKGTDWKIAEDNKDDEAKAGLMTLYNAQLYIVQKKLNLNENTKEDLNLSEAFLKTHEIHWFLAKDENLVDTKNVMIANVNYAPNTNSETIQNDFNALNSAYYFGDNYEPQTNYNFNIIAGGNLAQLDVEPFTDNEDDENNHKVYKTQGAPAGFILDSAFSENFNSLELTKESGFNHPSSSVYECTETEWSNSDLAKVLQNDFTNLAIAQQEGGKLSPKNLQEIAEHRYLSLYHDPISITDFLQNTIISKNIITLLQNSASSEQPWNKQNLPTEIRIAIPIQWPAGHFSPLCITLEVNSDELANLLTLNQNDITTEKIKNCFTLQTAQLYESNVLSDLDKDTAGNSTTTEAEKVKTKLSTHLQKIFLSNEDFNLNSYLPILQVNENPQDIGKSSGLLTAIQAQDFLNGKEPHTLPLPIQQGDDNDLEGISDQLKNWRNTATWNEENKKKYSEDSQRFILEQRRKFAIDYGVGLKIEKSESTPNPTKTKAELWNKQQKQMNLIEKKHNLSAYQQFLTTHSMKETGVKLFSNSPDGKPVELLKFQVPKEGGLEITISGPPTEEKIEAMLLKHLASGHKPKQDKLIITTTNPGLYIPLLKKHGFDLSKVSFETNKTAAPTPASEEENPMSSLMKGMQGM